ncbi:polymerase [Phyllobacterium salinisoli]|uniref:Polymerase n=1 Tax=Phyllobacterium salinisoli TaxID=1899321 RepID=A0A368K3Z8_9HYPH|nr:O-antigen ligase family protein [Phyllobacterium salinisoli]RCS23355.1 polymerase [Phyllobacterium salinisoli]
MSFNKKSFLMRRRIDPWILGAGSATMPIRLGFGPISLFLFSCIGIYLICGRHRAARPFARNFYICAVLYGIWSLGLILYRGEPIWDNRQIGYTLLFSVLSFAGPGMVLVRDPLRAFVLGARVGVTLAFLTALTIALIYGGRIGVGGNAAVFAFVAGLAAIGAAIPIPNAPRYLPNGPYYLVLGTAAVLTSETRAVLAVLPIFALIEIFISVSKFAPRIRMISYAALSLAALGLATVGPVDQIISKRFVGIVEYYDTGDKSKWEDKISADIRFALWDGAKQVISEHPITGVGSYVKMDMVRAKAGENAPMLAGFRHVHNTILDELLNDGLIGLILLLSCAYFGLSHIFRHSSSPGMTRSIIYFIVVCATYGLLHNPLLHEVTISGIFFYFGALNAGASRFIMAQRCRMGSVPERGQT